MKVSVNWLKQFIDFELPPVDELAQKIGAQLGAVEEVINLGEKYQGIVVAKVVKVEKHPDADKLHVCQIDAGKGEQVQVVCGAPNVHEGMLAAWISPGVVVPSTIGKDPFKLEARELRGVMSNGMLASPKELDLGDSHEGLLEIDKDVKPGDDFALTYKLDDFIIDIENKMFTHRPDCFGALGVAREIAGILHKPFHSPAWYAPNPELPGVEGEELRLSVKNELPELVPRFTAVTMSGVEVKPSPVWIQVALTKLGQKPINNIVDLTNFYMLVTGQPLHAYDYDKVKALSGGEATIVIRQPKKDEKIKLLNGKEIEPRSEAIMIATDKQLIGVGGVMGGTETEVDEHTKNIILECANFDMYSIRRTSMVHGLFTDAVTRFTKGQSPLQCAAVSAKTIGDIQKLAGGKVASPFMDDKNDLQTSALVNVSADFINKRLGEKLSVTDMKKLLENVEFQVEANGDELTVAAPFWRTDIEIPEDVVEEVGRLYGYDHLPMELPKRDLTPAPKDPLLELKSQIRNQLAKAGANEVLTYSFVHGDLLEKAGQDKSKAFQISNALSPDLQYYRLSLIPSLLEKIHPNIKAGYDEFALFEMGKIHSTSLDPGTDGLPPEFESTTLVVTANNKLKKAGAAYYQARKYLEKLLNTEPVFKPVPASMKDYSGVAPYDLNRAALVEIDGKNVGLVGEFKASVRKALKLPEYTAGFELDTAALQTLLTDANNYVALPRFPKVSQDITLKVAEDLSYQELFDCVSEEIQKAQPKNSFIKLSPLDIFQRPEDQEHKQITFHLEIANYDRTLTDTEVNKLLESAAAAAHKKIGAERI